MTLQYMVSTSCPIIGKSLVDFALLLEENSLYPDTLSSIHFLLEAIPVSLCIDGISDSFFENINSKEALSFADILISTAKDIQAMAKKERVRELERQVEAIKEEEEHKQSVRNKTK